MPVVVHQAIREDAHLDALSTLLQDRDERGKIAGLSKNVHAAVAAIHHVIVTSLAADTERACRGMAPVSPNSSGRQREAGVSPFGLPITCFLGNSILVRFSHQHD